METRNLDQKMFVESLAVLIFLVVIYVVSIFSQSHLSLFGKAMKVSKSTVAL